MKFISDDGNKNKKATAQGNTPGRSLTVIAEGSAGQQRGQVQPCRRW